MAQFLLITDLDNTLVGDDDAMALLNQKLVQQQATHGTKIVYSTGRSLTSYQCLCHEKSLVTPDAVVTGVGTAIYYQATSNPDVDWSQYLSDRWDRDRVAATAHQFSELEPQPDTEQSQFKVSFYLAEADAPTLISNLETKLRHQGLEVNIIYSGSKDLDILPAKADKGAAMTFLRQKWGFDMARTVVCGDSGNDRALFSVGQERGIIVGNARPELLDWHHDNPSPYRYLATATYAAGIIEGLTYFGFL